MATRYIPPRNTSMRQERNDIDDKAESEEKSPVNEKRVKPDKQKEPLSPEDSDNLNLGDNKPTPNNRVEKDDDIEVAP